MNTGAVLHDVQLQAQPRLLPRGAAGPVARRDATVNVEPPASAPSTLAGTADHYREGFARGRERGRQELLDEAREQARGEGWQQGFDEGVARGREAAAEELRQQAEAARHALGARTERLDAWLAAFPAQLQRGLAARLAAGEEDMIALSHELVCRVLGEHALETGRVAALVRQAIAQCCGIGTGGSANGLLAVRVHGSDLEALESDAELSQWLVRQGARGVRWVADSQVALGGCVVESTHGNLDARLETQLASMKAALLQARASLDPMPGERHE